MAGQRGLLFWRRIIRVRDQFFGSRHGFGARLGKIVQGVLQIRPMGDRLLVQERFQGWGERLADEALLERAALKWLSVSMHQQLTESTLVTCSCISTEMAGTLGGIARRKATQRAVFQAFCISCRMAAAARREEPGPPKDAMRCRSLARMMARRGASASKSKAALARFSGVAWPWMNSGKRLIGQEIGPGQILHGDEGARQHIK